MPASLPGQRLLGVMPATAARRRPRAGMLDVQQLPCFGSLQVPAGPCCWWPPGGDLHNGSRHPMRNCAVAAGSQHGKSLLADDAAASPGLRRRAIEQRPLPFNLSVVSDFMRSRDRYWKDRVQPAAATFSQVARALEGEVRPPSCCHPAPQPGQSSLRAAAGRQTPQLRRAAAVSHLWPTACALVGVSSAAGRQRPQPAGQQCPWRGGWAEALAGPWRSPAAASAVQGLVRLKLERNGIMVADSEPFDELIRSLVKERRERPPPRRSLTPPRRRSRCAAHESAAAAGCSKQMAACGLRHPCCQQGARPWPGLWWHCYRRVVHGRLTCSVLVCRGGSGRVRQYSPLPSRGRTRSPRSPPRRRSLSAASPRRDSRSPAGRAASRSPAGSPPPPQKRTRTPVRSASPVRRPLSRSPRRRGSPPVRGRCCPPFGPQLLCSLPACQLASSWGAAPTPCLLSGQDCRRPASPEPGVGGRWELGGGGAGSDRWKP